MKRKIYDDLLRWKKESKGGSAILIDGARRVGKSYIAEEFAKNEYRSYLKIDFFKAKDSLKRLFIDYLDDLDTFYSYLSAITHVDFHTRETLIIFDEVQCFPRARAAIKYLVEDGRYDFIETGSLLSIKENTEGIIIPSEEEHVSLYPLDFEEFLWANGENALFPFIAKSYVERKPLPEALHKKAMDMFRRYLLVGGMPQAVNKYRETLSFQAADKEKRNILTLYRNDIIKHAGPYKAKAANIFRKLPEQLSKHEKTFRLSSLSPDARYRDYDEAFYYLSDGAIANICYKANEPNIGLSMNVETNSLKCYMGDTGLLVSLAFSEKAIIQESLYEKLLSGHLSFNEGMVAENAVAQMLKAAGHSLFFFSKGKEGEESPMEIDFLISKASVTARHNIRPLEVKSGERVNPASLLRFATKYKDYIYEPTVIYDGAMKEKEGILYLPFYMVPLL